MALPRYDGPAWFGNIVVSDSRLLRGTPKPRSALPRASLRLNVDVQDAELIWRVNASGAASCCVAFAGCCQSAAGRRRPAIAIDHDARLAPTERRPTFAVRQFGGYLGQTGHCANLAPKAAHDPTRTCPRHYFDDLVSRDDPCRRERETERLCGLEV